MVWYIRRFRKCPKPTNSRCCQLAFGFACLVAAAFQIIVSVKNHDSVAIKAYLVNNLSSTDAEEVPRASSIANVPNSLKNFIPQTVHDIHGYEKVPGADLIGTGDNKYYEAKNITDAQHQCDISGPACKAFTYHRVPSLQGGTYLKQSLGIPGKADKSDLYIKAEYVNMYLQALAALSCAVPLDNMPARDEGCKLPDLDPWHDEIKPLVSRQPPIKCDETELYTTLRNNTLKIADKVLRGGHLEYISVKPIYRGHNDYSITFGPSHNLTFDSPSMRINNDLWKVTSVLKNNARNITYYMSAVEKAEVLQRTPKEGSPLDVYVIVFDGTSLAQFQRVLPRSYEFLKRDLGSHIFKGYSILGDGTLPNINALLTGLSLDECYKVKEARRGVPNAGTADEWPFIFKEFTKRGGSTLWSEDFANIGAYTLWLNGFQAPPVDHYARPLWSDTGGLCIGGQFQLKLHMRYLETFMTSYPGRRKFGLIFLNSLCHHNLNLLSVADLEIVNFLRNLKRDGLLESSMFMMMSDHGARFGNIRNTNQGRLEERLPFLSITLPKWFEEKYPAELNNLRANTHIITTPYDLHATFMHLLSFPKPPLKEKRGTSVFEALPGTRSCSTTGIPEQWCPCFTWRTIDTEHAHVIQGARTAVKTINRILTGNELSARLCHAVKLNKILRAVQTHGNGQKQQCSYQIQLETLPAHAQFEVTVLAVYTGEMHVYGEISRINLYGSQPHCIQDKLPSMRKYCVCR